MSSTEGYNGAFSGAQIDAAISTVRNKETAWDGKQDKGYTAAFSAEDWSAGAGECTITIPAGTHRLTGTAVDCRAFAFVSGQYRLGVWASLETYATVAGNGDIVLHYPDATGYSGAVILTAYKGPT